MARFVAASAGVAGVGIAISKVGRETIGFDRAMRNVNSIAQLNESQFGRLEKSVLKLAGKTAQAPETLANGLYDLVSSGFDASEAVDVLEASAKAATAGLTETETSAAAVAAVLNAYRKPAKDAGKVSDILFRTVDRGVISFEALAQNIGDVLPFASSLDVDLAQVGSSVATLTKQGIPAEETMTRIKNVMQAFIKPSKDMTKAFSELGVESGEALIQQEGFQGAVEAIAKTAGGSKAELAKLFPNIRALGGALALTGDNADAAREDLKGFEDASGATDRALQQQSKSISFQWNKIKASVSAAAIEVGTKAIPKIMEAGKEIAGIFKDDDLDLGEKIGQSFDVIGRHLAPLGRTLSDAFEAAVPKVADAAAAAAPKVAQAFIRGFMDAGVWGKLAIGGLIASRLSGGNVVGSVRGAGQQAGRAYGQSTSTAAAAYIGGAGFAKIDKAVRGAGSRLRSIGKGVLGFQLALGVADGITASGLNLGQRFQQAFSTISLGVIPSPLEEMDKQVTESTKRWGEDLQSAFQRGNWRDLGALSKELETLERAAEFDSMGRLVKQAEKLPKELRPVADEFLNTVANVRLLKGSLDHLPGSVKMEFLALDKDAQDKIASLGSRLIQLGKRETVTKILASDKDAQQKIAALKRALKSIPDEKVNINVVEHRQTRGGGRARGRGPGARTSRVGARASVLFQDDADLRGAQQERDDLDARFEAIDQRRERAALRRRIAAPGEAKRRKGEKRDDFKERLNDLKRDASEAKVELRQFNQEVKRSGQQRAIELRIEGIEKVRAAKEAIKDARGELRGMAQEAAGKFRAGLERGIDSTLTAQLAAIGDSPEAQELRSLIAGQGADQRSREDTDQQKALADARKNLEPATARLERAKASGNQQFIDVAQTAFNDLQAQVVQAEQAISDTARQRRIESLQQTVADREASANQEADIARASLDQQEADYAASLQAQLDAQVANLEARRQSYAEFAAAVNAILGPLGLSFAGSADQEAAFEVTVEPKAKPKRRRRKRRRAHGGPVTAGLAYTVGEEGEETFVPRTSGRILPHGRGGSGPVTVSFAGATVNMNGSRAAERMAHKLAWRLSTAAA